MILMNEDELSWDMALNIIIFAFERLVIAFHS